MYKYYLIDIGISACIIIVTFLTEKHSNYEGLLKGESYGKY